MSYKPDYGLKLLSEGVSTDVDHFFYDFQMNSLSVLGPGQYSTTVDMFFADERYAFSLDFDATLYNIILSKAHPEITAFLHNELSRDSSTPRTIDFDGNIAFGVRARLGELQQLPKESFVPFTAHEIF